jgi:hypothetical protein
MQVINHKTYLRRFKSRLKGGKSGLFYNLGRCPCSWIRISISNTGPDPSLFCPDLAPILSSKASNNSKKNLDFYYSVTSFGLLSMVKTDVNVASNRNKKKFEKKTSGSVSQWYGSANPDPDPY